MSPRFCGILLAKNRTLSSWFYYRFSKPLYYLVPYSGPKWTLDGATTLFVLVWCVEGLFLGFFWLTVNKAHYRLESAIAKTFLLFPRKKAIQQTRTATLFSISQSAPRSFPQPDVLHGHVCHETDNKWRLYFILCFYSQNTFMKRALNCLVMGWARKICRKIRGNSGLSKLELYVDDDAIHAMSMRIISTTNFYAHIYHSCKSLVRKWTWYDVGSVMSFTSTHFYKVTSRKKIHSGP